MWEYKILPRVGKTNIEIQRELTKLGQQGWELISVTGNGWHYLKRMIP